MENVNALAKRIVEEVRMAQELRKLLADHGMVGGEYSRVVDEIELRLVEQDAKRLADASKLFKP